MQNIQVLKTSLNLYLTILELNYTACNILKEITSSPAGTIVVFTTPSSKYYMNKW